MQRLKRLWIRTIKWQYSGLCLLVLLSLALHLSIIMNPPELVFDEYHYVNDARSILHGEGSQRGEHPPLARLLITTGIRVFGDNPFGWRFSAVLFGTGCLVLFWFICKALNMRLGATFLASFLFALENMTFLQASVAMLDVYNLFFMLGAFLLYLRGGYLVSGISAGLGTLCKLIGGLAVPAIGLHWFFSGRPRGWYFVVLLLSGPLFFFLLLPSFDWLLTGTLMDPIEHIRSMLSQSASLTFATVTHGAASRPWFWVLLPEVMWYWYPPTHYIGAVSFNVWALIIPVFVYMLIRAIKKDTAALFGVSWFTGLYLLWIPLSLVTNRVSYIYYFYPAIGAICLGLGMGLNQLLDVWRKRRKGKLAWTAIISVPAYLAIHVAVFVILSPVFSRWVSIIPIPPNP
ncbi:MAG: glycosyltransferase family 39 protein [Dehalococcoidales bacterium]|nr:glycosyltransferase family 39 protein [Dehalococcoidales bacterium]